MNSEFKKMLKRVNLDEIIAYVLCESGTEGKQAERYDKQVDNSFDTFFERIEELYPIADRNDNKLFDIISDFAVLHDKVYFEMGIVIGFQLYKNLEQGYRNINADTNRSLNKPFPNELPKYGSILNIFVEQRMDMPLDKYLKTDEEYQKVMEISDKKQEQLETMKLDKVQWELIDDTISALNGLGAEYGRVAYQLGFQDGVTIITELRNMLRE